MHFLCNCDRSGHATLALYKSPKNACIMAIFFHLKVVVCLCSLSLKRLSNGAFGDAAEDGKYTQVG